MEITTELLADLKAKAEAATPGPWVTGPEECEDQRQIFAQREDDHSIHDWQIAETKYAGTATDPAYIAAVSPDVLLALIARVERLEREANWLARKMADSSILKVPCHQNCNWCDKACMQQHWRKVARKAVEKHNEQR